MSENLKGHPDYEVGYFDAINERPDEGNGSAEYAAGRAAGLFARGAFERAGFQQDGEDSFSLKMRL